MRPVWHQWVDAVHESDSQRRFFVLQVRPDLGNLPAEVNSYVAYFPTILAINDASARLYWGDDTKPSKSLAPLVAVRYPYGAPRTVELLERWYQLVIVSTVELNPPSVLAKPPPLIKAAEPTPSENGGISSVSEGKSERASDLPQHRSSLGTGIRANSTPGQHVGRYRDPPRRIRVTLPIK